MLSKEETEALVRQALKQSFEVPYQTFATSPVEVLKILLEDDDFLCELFVKMQMAVLRKAASVSPQA